MRDDCIIAVEQAIGRSLSKAEQKTIEDAVSKQMRLLARKDPEAWMALTPQERLDQGAKAAADDMIFQLQRQQQLVRMTIAAHDRIETMLNDALDAIPDKNFKAGQRGRIVSQLLAFDVKAKGMQMSVESWAKSIRDEAMGNLLPVWESTKGNVLGLFEDAQGVRDLYKEFHGEDSGNAAAKKAAEAWFKVTDELRDRANKSGMSIGDLEDWHKPQSHSQGAVAKAGPDKWANDILPLLDRSKYLNEDGTRMTDEDMHDLLNACYDSIVTKNFIDPTDGTFFSGKTANRMSQHRVLFFKDAESALTYDSAYGDKNLWATMTSHVARISRNIALNEQLGPDAAKTFKYFNDRMALDDARQFPENAARIKLWQGFNERLYDYVSGKQRIGDQRVADAFQAYRNWKVATSLGKVALTALGDEAGMAATAFANKVPYTDAAIRQLKYLNPLDGTDRAAAAHAGLGLNGLLGEVNRFGSEEFGGEGTSTAGKTAAFTAKAATNVMKYSGAEPLWDARRRALGSVLQSYIGKMASLHENFSDLHPDDAGVLLNKGVTENDWQVWKRGKTEDWGYGAHTVLTPKAIHEIPDSELAHLGDPTALRRHAATMLLGHVLEETGMGVMDTGARQRVAMSLGTDKGTYGGELIRSAGLFKGFSVAMMSKHWARMAEMESGKTKYGAAIIVGGMALAALVAQLRSIVSGKDPENMADPKFWGAAALRGGGLGYYGEFVYSELNQRDTDLVSAIAGPVVTDPQQVWKLTGGAFFKHARGERVDEGANLIRFTKDNIPGLNMWYLQAAANHLLWYEMQDAVNPGYLDRMQQRAQDERGTTTWWDPHDMAPARAPDFSKAFDLDAANESTQRTFDKMQRSFER